MRLEDYEVRALGVAFGFCTDDDDQPYVWFDPCLTVSGRWGDVWDVGLTIVQTLGETRGSLIMDHRDVYVDPRDPGYVEIRFPGVQPETLPEPAPLTDREVLDRALAAAWKALNGLASDEDLSGVEIDLADGLGDLAHAAQNFLGNNP